MLKFETLKELAIQSNFIIIKSGTTIQVGNLKTKKITCCNCIEQVIILIKGQH
ncbi:MAG: hypothetical protein ACJAT7_003451 [Psychromonas sp.]|jgi:hypothetical protein|uniref:hypothetical protein n=1 Tax=Psychromonas sp. TaxID=1884585 RepID=UPI0039E21449